MKKYFPQTSPVPFKDRYETDSSTQEHSLGDVVKSTSPPRLGFHVDVHAVKGDEPPLEPRDDVDHHDHDHDHVPRALDDHDDDLTEESGGAREDEAGAASAVDTHAQRGPHARIESLEHDDDAQRRRLLERDRFERHVYRDRARREQRQRRTERAAQRSFRGRGRSSGGPRNLDGLERRADRSDPELSGNVDQRTDPVRDRSPRGVPGDDHSRVHDHLSRVAAHPRPLRRPLVTRAQGAAMVLYFVLLPYVVYSKWRQLGHHADADVVRTILVLLAVFWFASFAQLIVNIRRLRRGRRVGAGASAWLAGVVVALMALLIPAAHATHPSVAASISRRAPQSLTPPAHRSLPRTLGEASGVPLALMAKRRQDLLREANDDPSDVDFDVEESIDLLRRRDPDLIARLAGLAGDRTDGVLDVTDHLLGAPSESPTTPLVACSLGPSATGALVGFAREGGRLPVRPSWNSADLEENIVTLHDGRVLFARSEPELLRALATRSLRRGLVVYLGPADEIDDDLAACTITVRPHVERGGPSTRETLVAAKPTPQSGDLRVELLRADPQVVGLVEPFAPTLRRRCVEMVAYLALRSQDAVVSHDLHLTSPNVRQSRELVPQRQT
ncbi:MAG: hypothetical protein JWM55_328 [Acidimicrobiaceae bacterium]|nr:hypothetical protein [Acidimicrobiaceae bacterium]